MIAFSSVSLNKLNVISKLIPSPPFIPCHIGVVVNVNDGLIKFNNEFFEFCKLLIISNPELNPSDPFPFNRLFAEYLPLFHCYTT